MAFSKKMIGQQEIVPGPVEPGQLPEPTEIACIEVTKVYDACSQRICLDNIPPITFVPSVLNLTPSFGEITNITVSLVTPPGFVITPLPDRPGFARVEATFQVTYDIVINYPDGTTQTLPGNITTFNKDIVLYVPDPNVAIMKYEALAEGLYGKVNLGVTTTVEVIIGVWIVIKSAVDVQLLVPSYGFCPTPAACEEFVTDVCEIFNQKPFPSFDPPQMHQNPY
ncbi:hypothetical protein JCM16816_16230 [Thermoanaerobacter brockii subsp. lactiethylicus]|jgi:hypothetical protein|uniref:hypothetical protein n=1 Tax=unclassified Thermoanaerobacter TaxID=2636821 RepID=UPI0000E1E409|nr:hypothetical protein [Thermoanaerobacter sp. X514]KUJ91040.1 MAG: hypothetical protein XD37_0761 [Thermoanaerobacter thermocopriae]MDI3500241.1 hypothetical protein [Thermoanaerobacter sp.]ABY93300.1 hypothetical protein Teth514_2028 [Thermoanaerobacter sp. X514]MDI3528878.1 hypothetical protein [Thermoanaerobacter sp.]MDK2814254.1 hypothetical protein [Thermoanaerobacter sp.]